MAIQFARMEYVKRSEGGNVCRKSAYNMRGQVQDPTTRNVFSFSNREDGIFSEILLPKGASEKFKDSAYLWNMVELVENRQNSQLAKEIVLALPDNNEISLDDKIELCRRFAQEHFVDKGVAVQVDIHEPHHVKDKNWHAHLLITTRRFNESGEGFAKNKARDLDAQVRKFKVVEGEEWGKIWRDIQNEYFKEKGLDIRVDEIGIVPQEHLGPVRMRKHMSDINQKNEALKEANLAASRDPDDVVQHLSRVHAAFTEQHIDSYLKKYVVGEHIESVKEGVLNHKDIMPLYNKHSGEKVAYYTTKAVRAEEERVLREGDRINGSSKIQAMPPRVREVVETRTFSKEQLSVFEYAVSGDQGIKVIEGRAGTGKSYVLHGIREAYERSGARVIGLTKDNGPRNEMLDNGFREAYTAKKFLFLCHNNRMHVRNGSIFLVDEAALLETPTYNELFKVAREHSCKIILVGDDRQQNSIERGGMFTVLAERYGSMALTEVRRQKEEWQRSVSEYLSDGKFNQALDLLEQNQRIYWNSTREESLSNLVEKWCRDKFEKPEQNRLILAHRNVDVDTINQAIQRVQQALGKVSTKEYVCETYRGDMAFAEGDRVIFAKTDKGQGLVAGDMGTLHKASETSFTVLKDKGDKVSFDPGLYKGLNLAYATTIYKAQGKTVDAAYVLHSPTMNEKQNYVSLTRQVEDVHFFVTRDDTRNLSQLAIQMGKEDDKISSLEFYTAADMEKLRRDDSSKFHKLAYSLEDSVKNVLHNIKDRLHTNAEFYSYKGDTDTSVATVKVRDAEKRWQQEAAEERANSNMDNASQHTNAKARDKHADNTVSHTSDAGDESHKGKSNRSLIEASQVEEALKKDIRGFATHLLGEPDKKLSTPHELCFRKDGKVFVNLETGLWKDFVNDTGGNLFSLIQREHGGDFKEALAYAASYAGISENTQAIAKKETKVAETAKEIIKTVDTDKVKRVLELHEKSMPVEGTLGERYLREHRDIQGELSVDLRFSNKVYNSELKREIPALIAFARDKENNVTACQVIYLDKSTGNKADLNISKKTFGNLSGSFVELQKGEGVTYLAEGVETALSVKEIGINGNIVASLGVQNIKHYNRDGQSLVICADNDGPNAPSRTVIEKSIATLKKNGYTTRVIEPQLTGEDFNDVLKKQGREAVAQYFGINAKDKGEVSRSHLSTKQLHETNTTAKAKEENSSKLDTVKELQSLTKQYQKELENIYRKKTGASYKPSTFKEEIASVAYRAAQEAVVNGAPRNTKELQLLLAKNQYEHRRLIEIKEALSSKEGRPGDNWMQAHIKAEMVVAIEGRLFADGRSRQDKLTKEDKLQVQGKAKELSNSSTIDKLKAYQEEAKKEYGLNAEAAKMFALQRVTAEERYGIKSLDTLQMQALLKAVQYGMEQYKQYHIQYAIKLDSQGENVNERQLKYIEHAAKFKAHYEAREVLVHTLGRQDGSLPTKRELQKLEDRSEKEFRANKEVYDVRQTQQQREIQKAQTKQVDRGFNR